MKHPRLYLPGPLLPGQELELPAEPAQHLRVLRLSPGSTLTLFNGEGGEYRCRLLSLERRSGQVQVLEKVEREAESPLSITLIQGISKGERMDFTIQKAVELGVARIAPVFSERSVVQLEGERLARREARWRAVISSACEQCGRNTLPELLPAVRLHDAWEQSPNGLRLMLDPQGEASLGSLQPTDSVTLLVGPEGGLSQIEIEAAAVSGFLGLRLGPRILRTETAGIAALAALQTLAGDLG